jgi:hypothetical protein
MIEVRDGGIFEKLPGRVTGEDHTFINVRFDNMACCSSFCGENQKSCISSFNMATAIGDAGSACALPMAVIGPVPGPGSNGTKETRSSEPRANIRSVAQAREITVKPELFVHLTLP